MTVPHMVSIHQVLAKADITLLNSVQVEWSLLAWKARNSGHILRFGFPVPHFHFCNTDTRTGWTYWTSAMMCYIFGIERCSQLPTMCCSYIPGLVIRRCQCFLKLCLWPFLFHFNTVPTAHGYWPPIERLVSWWCVYSQSCKPTNWLIGWW